MEEKATNDVSDKKRRTKRHCLLGVCIGRYSSILCIINPIYWFFIFKYAKPIKYIFLIDFQVLVLNN